MESLDVSRMLSARVEDMTGRDLAILAFLEAAYAEAARIAGSPDCNERRRLLAVARKVALLNPDFAEALLGAAEEAARQHRALGPD